MYTVGIYGLITRRDGKFLIIRRAAHDSMPGLWELPGGGLNEGEQVEDGIMREVFEETGLRVKVLAPISTASFPRRKNREPKFILRVAYSCAVFPEKQTVKLSKDHSQFQWVKKEELIKITHSEFLKEIIEDHSRLYNL